ncbi:MAG: hypothetical protein GY713_17675 [Actinomycetia bacterium]|nr:hypothetical protein [Actinomycetes bacterium]
MDADPQELVAHIEADDYVIVEDAIDPSLRSARNTGCFSSSLPSSTRAH